MTSSSQNQVLSEFAVSYWVVKVKLKEVVTEYESSYARMGLLIQINLTSFKYSHEYY